MQCARCKSIVADTAAVCPTCGAAFGQVDSYSANSMALASTMMSSSQPSPPTMASNAPSAVQSSQQSPPPAPRYIVTPAPQQQPPPQYQQPVQQQAPMYSAQGAIVPYQSPSQQTPGAYGPPQYPMNPYSQQYPMQQAVVQGPTPGLAVAALICGLLGWIPFWIGFILCLLAITFGGIVVANTKPGQAGRGLAITGLIFGLVLLLPAACGL